MVCTVIGSDTVMDNRCRWARRRSRLADRVVVEIVGSHEQGHACAEAGEGAREEGGPLGFGDHAAEGGIFRIGRVFVKLGLLGKKPLGSGPAT